MVSLKKYGFHLNSVVPTPDERPSLVAGRVAVPDARAEAEVSPQSGAAHEDRLSEATSLDDILKAILGEDPTPSDDYNRFVEAVDNQVKDIRREFGLAESMVEESELPNLQALQPHHVEPTADVEPEPSSGLKPEPGFGRTSEAQAPPEARTEQADPEGVRDASGSTNWISGSARALARVLGRGHSPRHRLLLVGLVIGGMSTVAPAVGAVAASNSWAVTAMATTPPNAVPIDVASAGGGVCHQACSCVVAVTDARLGGRVEGGSGADPRTEDHLRADSSDRAQ